MRANLFFVASVFVLAVFISGCTFQQNENRQANNATAPEKLPEISFLNAYEDGKTVYVQFILSDRKAREGFLDITITSNEGFVVLKKTENISLRDFMETAKCTHEFCGIEMMYETEIPLDINDEADYSIQLAFRKGESSVKANAKVEHMVK